MMDIQLWVILLASVAAALAAGVQLARSGARGTRAERQMREELRSAREESRAAARELREELAASLKSSSQMIGETFAQVARQQQERIEQMGRQLQAFSQGNQELLEKIRATLDERVQVLQAGNEKKLDALREETTTGLAKTSESVTKSLDATLKAQQAQAETLTRELKELSEANRTTLDRLRSTFDERFLALQASNEKKLDEMRRTVDEKLHDTLEKRLGESFKLVSERLDTVHKGLGEMQTLAAGVGDLKRVLTNVKARGTWAEVQLGALLEQVLTAAQFGRNVCVKPGSEQRVEFAVRLPGPKDEPGSPVWLPIDSKFPQEDYLRLQDAAERADAVAVQKAQDELGRAVRVAARDIHDKYLNVPLTTDFAILFLATEGLYAEVLRQPALVEDLQQQLRIVIAGPTTLVAILSSLRMGFQTLAIEQRASEVWKVLSAVKTEFGKFGDVLDKVQRQLNTASRTIEQTGVRSRALQRKLRGVEELPEAESQALLGFDSALEAEEAEEAEETDGRDDLERAS